MSTIVSKKGYVKELKFLPEIFQKQYEGFYDLIRDFHYYLVSYGVKSGKDFRKHYFAIGNYVASDVPKERIDIYKGDIKFKEISKSWGFSSFTDFSAAINHLKDIGILEIKDLNSYHFAARFTDEAIEKFDKITIPKNPLVTEFEKGLASEMGEIIDEINIFFEMKEGHERIEEKINEIAKWEKRLGELKFDMKEIKIMLKEIKDSADDEDVVNIIEELISITSVGEFMILLLKVLKNKKIKQLVEPILKEKSEIFEKKKRLYLPGPSQM
ncbi:MAG: hypothetical protein ACFFC1_09100 [Promethearchaeota archaeon]